QSQVLSLEEAQVRAIQASPALFAARAAVDAATARERQAGAFPNPVLTYGREQTSAAGLTNSQNIALVEQRIDFGGQRGARREAAGLRRVVAVAQLAAREADVRYEVTRAYATAVAADQRAARAREAAEIFLRAKRITTERLASGDISGYSNRRIGLEAARYATVRAEADLAHQSARLTLATLLGAAGEPMLALALDEALATSPPPPLDSLQAKALAVRPELRAAEAETLASAADARTATREAFPGPLAGLGFKNERGAGGNQDFNGFVLTVSVPIPVWDRRGAAASAFEAEGRVHASEITRLHREISREVELAWAALNTVEEQLAVIGPELGESSQAALRAAEAAYLEGEISLVDWLDAVRAYQEAESSFATLQAEFVIRRAALERAVGEPFN
ncbi:MAG TPA: TolC family protein, partial [Gemmatimonadales bacterium]